MLLRTSVILGVLSAMLSILSFANQLVIARTFGVTPPLDAYFQAVSLPFMVTGMMGGVFGYAMIPALVHGAASEGDLRPLAGGFFIAFAVCGVLVAVVGSVSAHLLLRLLGSSHAQPAFEETAVQVARLAWWSCGLSIVMSYLASVANATRRFFTPLLATAFPYASSIAACLILAKRFGVYSLAIGLIAGSVASVVFLLATVRRDLVFRAGHRVRADVAQFFRSAGSVFVAMLPFGAYLAVDAFWAPRIGPSALSTMGYSQRLFVAIGSLVVVGPASVLQPRMADAVARGRLDDFRRDVARAVRMTLAVTLPVAVAVSILRVPIITVLFQRGAFDAQATARVAALVPWMMAAMVGNVCLVVMYKAIFALRDFRTAILVGLLGPGVYFVLAGVSSRAAGIVGLGVANAVSWWILFAVTWFRIETSHERAPQRDRAKFATNLVAGLAIVAIVTLPGRRFLIDPLVVHGSMALAGGLAAVAFAAALAFFASTLVLFPVVEIGALAEAFRIPRPGRRGLTKA